MNALIPDMRNVYIGEYELENIKPRKVNTKFYSNESTEALTEMVKKFGILDPLVIDSDGNLIHGENRYRVAKSLGLSTVPVVVSKVVPAKMKTTDAYHLLADRLVEWDKWDYKEDLEDILADLSTEDINGQKWMDVFNLIAWSVEDTSVKATATEETLQELSKVATRWTQTRFNFNDAQLLYIEALRKEILALRERMIAADDIAGGVVEKYNRHVQEEKDYLEQGEAVKPSSELLGELKDKYSVTEAPSLGETALRHLEASSNDVFKGDGSRMMTEVQFIFFAKTYAKVEEAEAREFYSKSSDDEFDAYVQKYMDEDPTIPANQSKVVGVENV